MGSLSRASRQSMTMGQTSSQVRSTEIGTSGADQSTLMETSSVGNNKRSTFKRKQKAVIEESARALLQLKEKFPLNKDEIAEPTMFLAVNVNAKDSIEAHQVTDTSGKRKRQRHEFRERNGESPKRARLNKSTSIVISQTALLPPSFITDDVTMEESGASPKTQIVVKPKPIMQQLLAETDNEQSDAPIQTLDRLSSRGVKIPRRQTHQKERKNQSQSRVESSDAAAQEQPNHPDFDLPINTVLINEPPLPISKPLEKSTVTNCHENANQKYYTQATLEAMGDEGSDVVMPTGGPIGQLKEVGGDEQHRNPPESENLSLLLPPDSESFNEWSLNSEDSDESTSKVKRGKMTPPPLAKPSKPLGNKTQQGGKKEKNYDPPLDVIAVKGGVWTQAEISKLETFRKNYCKENELSTFQFNALVQSTVRYDKGAAALFYELHESFPYRTRMSTMRVCRRRFHNFPARGTWTQSEDESLKQAVSEKGRSWTAVGEMINRFPEDCRDRYRNYHVNAHNRNRESWTEAEILNLCRAVHECMAKMRGHKQQAKLEKFVGREFPESESESDEEVRDMKLINWQTVSDAMGPGGGRSRLQCSLKWAQLRMTERVKYMKRVNDALKERPPAETGKTKKPKRRNWRADQAQRTLSNMRAGDRYDFLQAFATCNAREEENIAWRFLGDEAFRSRWTVAERKMALQIFKNEVPEGNKMNYHDVANRLLTKLMAESGHRLDEHWDRGQDPDIHGESREQHSAAKESGSKGLPKKSKRKGLSREGTRKGLPKGVEDEKVKGDRFVISRDDEEQDNDVQEATEAEDILVSQSGTSDKVEVEVLKEGMSAKASNRKAQEGRTNSVVDAHRKRSSAKDASSILTAASAYKEPLEAQADKIVFADSSAPVTRGLPARACGEILHLSAAATDDRTREDRPNEDVGFDTDDDSLFGTGNKSPEPTEAAAQDAAQEALSDNGSDDVTPVRTTAEVADDETKADSSDGEVIDATPARKGKAGADDATQEVSSESPIATTDDETQAHNDGDNNDDDDTGTDSDADSLFGKPLAS